MHICLRLACLLFVIATAVSWSPASAQPAQSEMPKADRNECNELGDDGRPLLLRPGDKGYRHRCLHKPYFTLYQNAECHCHTGYCRPTIARHINGETWVLIQGNWYTFSDKVLKHKNVIPEALWIQEAHVCARPTGNILPDGRPEVEIECVIINGSS